MNKSIKNNINFIDNPNGRKWSFGYIKFIGEFNLIDLIIILIALLITIPFWFVQEISKPLLVLFSVLIYFLVIILITEIKGWKLYERILNLFLFLWKNKRIQLVEFLSDNSHVFEITFGYDINNLSKFDISKIDNQINDFFASVNGQIKIFKFGSTFRTDEVINALLDKITCIDDQTFEGKNRRKILYSQLENIQRFKVKMPNIYIQFLKSDSQEIKKSLQLLGNSLTYKQINDDEWNAIKMSNFLFTDENGFYKIKRRKIISENNDNEQALALIEFSRNIPSFWVQNLLIDDNLSFCIKMKKPNYEEYQKIKKSIKRWSKSVLNESIEDIKGKNFFKTKNKIESVNAKNDVMMEMIVGKNDLRLINGFVIIQKNNDNKLSLRKQIYDLDWKLSKKDGLSLNVVDGKQDDLYREFFLDDNSLKRWFPTNVSTITNAMPFQNESFLDKEGIYIGYSNYLFPFVFNAWKTSNSGKHTGILAKTGGGKTILIKKLIVADEVLHDTIQYVLDPKNDGYGNIFNKFNGIEINVIKKWLNPLKLNLNVVDNLHEKLLMIDNKVIEIQEFLFILFAKEAKYSKMTNLLSDFSDKLKQIYLLKITDLSNGKEFTFKDIYKWISNENRKTYQFIFNKLIYGTYSMFNNYENLEINSYKSIVFNLHEVLELPNENISNAIMFLIFNKIIDKIYYRKNLQVNLSLWIDEAGQFFKNNFLVKKFEKLMIKSRSFNTKITWATQNPTDLLDNENKTLASIFANTEHLFVGQIKDSQIGVINNMFKMAETEVFSETEKNHIKDSTSDYDKGKFIYINSNERHLIQTDYDNDFILKKWIEEFKEKYNRG